MFTIPTQVQTTYTTQYTDLDTFNTLILEQQDFLFRVALRLMKDEDQAADAVQDGCLLAFNKISSFRGGSIRNWLARIVVNVCYDELRRQRRHPTQALEPVDTDQEEISSPHWLADFSMNPEFQYDANELEQMIAKCLETLPYRHRTVLILIDVEEFSYEEAAEILSVPTGTVKSRLARARAQFSSSLKNLDNAGLPKSNCTSPDALMN